MKRKKLRQYEIYKISTDRLTETKNKKIKIVSLDIDKRQALENGELVKIQANQLTHAIIDYMGNSDIDMSEIIVNVVVPTESKKTGEKAYKELATKGFTFNGNRYVRLFSGSGQIRRNTITFIREDLYTPMLNKLLCGLSLEDFGDTFNAAKFNAYAGLNMSGCHLLPFELSPRVCVVDDYEAIRPHDTVNYVTESQVQYITLPECDYILSDDDSEYSIVDGKAIRKSDGTEFTLRKGIRKEVKTMPYDEIESSPALNSFDGQGLMSPAWAQKVSEYLGYGYIPSEMIIRAPWVKGLLACVPFYEYFADNGITEITDSFGKVQNISDVDVILSKSQFKMWKIYQAKCEAMGVNAWDYHQESMRKNRLLWGIVKPNGKTDDTEKELNYQYLQALKLDSEDVDALCKRTEDFLKQLNTGNLEEVYASLVINAKGFSDGIDVDCDYKKLFQKVIETNPNFINDKYIRASILKECEAKLNGAKLGKLLVRGNFQFCVSDPIAQLEWIAKNHCGLDIDVIGVVPAGYLYSNYWLNSEDCQNEIVLMRSPLIDRNEIAKRKLVKAQESLLRFLQSGIVYSVHDLTALQQGGCDFDGDIIFSTNNKIVAKGCYEYGIAKPLYYRLNTADLVGAITPENIIEADVRGLNSAVGTISNKGGSLYAMLHNYQEGSDIYNQIYNGIIELGQIVGMEIDRIKTAVSPTFPLEWSALQPKSIQKRDFTSDKIESDEELQGIYRHNNFVPDIKPYYFRYNYGYIDDGIRQLDRAFNKVSVLTYGLKLPELLAKYENGSVTDEMSYLCKQYINAYPVIQSDCVVNHVCRRFENFEKSMKKQVRAEGTNMLCDYSGDTVLEENITNEVKNLLKGYKRYKRILTRNNNGNYRDGAKKIRENTANALDMMRTYYKQEIISITGSVKAAFDYMVKATSDEALIWEILDTGILDLIRRDVVQ